MKSIIKTLLILTIILALFSFVSAAQTCNINIYGTVKDWKGNNLYRANVDLYINGDLVASDRTDNGKYIIEYEISEGLEGREWKIIATYGGNSLEKTGIIQCSKSYKIDLTIGNLGLVSKRVSEDLLIYGLDLETGKSLKGVHITIANNTPDQVIKEGVTNKDGVFQTQVYGTNLIVTGKYGSNTVTVKPYYFVQGYEDKVYIYTDRPIYRPSQKVFFKVVVWNNTAGNFSISKDVQCNLKIYTPKRDSIYKKEFLTNEFGTFSGNITLSEEPPLGRYQIEVSVYGKKYYGYFEVQEYKKPEYKVDLTPEKKVYINGETAKINLKAEYYFGKPVKGADVVYKITQQYYYPPCKGYDCYYISSPRIVPPPYYPQKPITSGKTKTDNNGIAKIEFNVRSEQESNVIVEAEVIDESRRTVSGSTSLWVAPALFKLEIRTDKRLYKVGEVVHASIKAVDYEKNPISTSVQVKVNRLNWTRYKQEKILVLDKTLRTEANGVAEFDFTTSVEGNYNIEVSGKDKKGNKVKREINIWVNKERWYGTFNRLELILDKDSYESGETAKLLINSPIRDFSAFITIEGDKIYGYQYITTDGTSALIDIPIKSEYSPNVHISAILAKEGNRYIDNIILKVPPKDKNITVEIISDKKEYTPRETAKFTIKTLKNGNPIDTELSLGLVDKAIYALSKDITENIFDFFYSERPNRVNTAYSWYYYPYLVEERAIGVEGTPIPTPAEAPAPAVKKIGASEFAPFTVRKYFPDTAYWNANIKTKNGIAKVEIPIPDTLTTWRATAKALSLNKEVGENKEEIITSKKLIARLETPRFITSGDELLISGIIHNYLNTTAEVQVSLEASGLKILDEVNKTLTIAPEDSERIDWRVVADNCCSAKIKLIALTSYESDAMELAIPIIPHGIEKINATTGILTDNNNSVDIVITYPKGTINNASSAILYISPSIAGTALDALEYLAGYPYGCVEQTMSRFLPDVIVSNTLSELKLENKKLEKELPDMVSKGLQRLYKFQHSDGGWGWWEKDEANPFMTAYVVYGLTLAEYNKYYIDEKVLNNGIISLKEQIASVDNLNTKSYMLYVLSFHEKVDLSDLFANRDKLNDYAKSLIALAYVNNNNTDNAITIIKELEDSAKCTSTECSWGGETWHYRWEQNDIETTAYVIKAFIALDSDNPKIPLAINYLVRRKNGNYWTSTKSTATAIFA
ncbi:MAG TPA: hypothetical protein EYP22_05700, partial [Methanosarcinales archaeon]|nr:hypothetical protein [Methanosarcinales archaeon]